MDLGMDMHMVYWGARTEGSIVCPRGTCSVFSILLECAVCTAAPFVPRYNLRINLWRKFICKLIACSRAAVVLIIIINYVAQRSN